MSRSATRRSGLHTVRTVGNRGLTRFQNAALGTQLTDFRSGYYGISVSALKQIPFERNSDGYGFDMQMMIQFNDAGFHIAEVSVPDDGADATRRADWLRSAADALVETVAYRLQKAGFGDGSRITLNEEYQLKPSEDSSHGRISTLLAARPAAKILDLGCSSGLLAERLQEMGHHVTGVDVNEFPEAAERMSAFYKA